ncbi:MAG: dihydroorotase, partial [Pseudomonadota bacterium]
IGLITSRPARLLRIDAGQLAEGARADMVWFDPDASWQIRSRQSTLSPGLGNNTPFDGTPPVQGQVLQSWVGGRCVYRRNA